jgi:hypothetical protein
MKLFISIFILALLANCSPVVTTPIEEINKNAERYEGKRVAVRGEVMGVLGILGFKAYMVEDDTDEIVVLTKKDLPEKGEERKVVGVVKRAFKIDDKSLTVIFEGKWNKKDMGF